MVSPSDIEFSDLEDEYLQNPEQVSEEFVQEVERLLSVELPEAYVDLMKRHNGGYIPEHLLRIEAPGHLLWQIISQMAS